MHAAEALATNGKVTKTEFYESLQVDRTWEYHRKATADVVCTLGSQMG